MAKKRLGTYRSKRDFDVTPEPAGDDDRPDPSGRDRFVVQEHHARRLHWDFRLERAGVLVSWAVPKGVPADPKVNHLAVPTEDHPLSYIDFAGEIPKGEYGGGTVRIWDRGRYDCHKWEPGKVEVTLHGDRVQGRYALFRTGEDRWMIHRMDPPQDPDREPLPEAMAVMRPRRRRALPSDEERWAFEVRWAGVRGLLWSEGGRVRLLADGDGDDVVPLFPELRALGRALGAREALVDGVLTVPGDDGRPDAELLAERLAAEGASDSVVRRLSRQHPAVLMVVDVLHDEGRPRLDEPWADRRRRLDAMVLAGPAWQTPATHAEGGALLDAVRAQGLPGVVAKRVDSVYEPGVVSSSWVEVLAR